MSKCPNCGQDYEAKFCSNCGKKLQEKTCPKCGINSYSSANFCSECGYDFSTENAISKEKITAKDWIKAHRGVIIGIVAVIVVIAAFISIILVCSLSNNNGTYYKLVNNGELDKTNYFVLKSGKWEDSDGVTGTYKVDGERITFYVDFFGETEELCDGTLVDGVLKVNGYTYVTEEVDTSKVVGKSLTIFLVEKQIQ